MVIEIIFLLIILLIALGPLLGLTSLIYNDSTHLDTDDVLLATD